MKKFHVEIKDIEEGKMVVNMDSDAIIGAFHNASEGSVQCVGATYCPATTIVGVIESVKEVIDELYEKNPELKILDGAVSTERENKKSEEKTDKSKTSSSKEDAFKALSELKEVLEGLKELKNLVKEVEKEEDPFDRLVKRMFS